MHRWTEAQTRRRPDQVSKSVCTNASDLNRNPQESKSESTSVTSHAGTHVSGVAGHPDTELFNITLGTSFADLPTSPPQQLVASDVRLSHGGDSRMVGCSMSSCPARAVEPATRPSKGERAEEAALCCPARVSSPRHQNWERQCTSKMTACTGHPVPEAPPRKGMRGPQCSRCGSLGSLRQRPADMLWTA
jgi:hypothetical protein